VQNDQLHELSMARGWIEIDLARLSLLRRQQDLARRHLRAARLASNAQGSRLMLDEIDGIEARLSS
jgi:hypothetical protein